MVRIISLFGSQAEATRAVEALHASDFESIEIEVIENSRELDYGDTGIVAPAPNASTGVAGAVAIPDPLQDLDLDDEEAAWFAQGVRGGGVVISAEVDEDDAGTVAQILRDHGGRTYERT